MKYEDRIPLFLRMMSEPGQPFTLMSGVMVSIPLEENAPLAVALQTKVRAAVDEVFRLGVVVRDDSDRSHCITALREIHKCARFGGKPAGASLKRESAQIEGLARSLVPGSDLIVRSTVTGREISVPRVRRVAKIPGMGKGDALIEGDASIRVSLKWADSPERMNQWGGSAYVGENLLEMMAGTAKGWDGHETLILPLPQNLPGLIPTLWGSDQDGADAILVSCAPITQCPGSGRLLCHSVYLRGEIPEGDWAPALVLRRFRGRRAKLGSLTLQNARIGVYPLGYRRGRVIEVNTN